MGRDGEREGELELLRGGAEDLQELQVDVLVLDHCGRSDGLLGEFQPERMGYQGFDGGGAYDCYVGQS